MDAELSIDEIACDGTGLVERLERAMAMHGERIAFVHGETTLSYHALANRSRSMAAYLADIAGIRKGERVAIILPNSVAYAIAVIGVIRAGGVVVNVNPMYTPRELSHVIDSTGPTVVVTHGRCIETLKTALVEGAEKPGVIMAVDGDRSLTAIEGVPIIDYEIAAAYAASGFRGANTSPADLVALQSTGGTTGLPKAAMLTHGNLLAAINQAVERIIPRLPDGQEYAALSVLPFYHVFGMVVGLLAGVVIGFKNVLPSHPQNIDSVVEEVESHGINFLAAVDVLLELLLASPRFAAMKHHFGMVISGGMAAKKSTCEQWRRITGCPVLQGYGMTETSALISFASDDEFDGSVGVPVAATSVSIRDEHGREVDAGEIGEIFVKGPQVMCGYWRAEEETRSSFAADGYLATGDYGRMEVDGRLFIMDRKKDVIIVSGFNVYPQEVEQVYSEMPSIRAAVCVGVLAENRSEQACLIVVTDPRRPAPCRDEIVEFGYRYLAPYKVPKLVCFVDAIPRTAVGKVDRVQARKIASERVFS